MDDMPRLHDATLLQIGFAWERGEAFVTCETMPGQHTQIKAFGVTRLIVPRENPWGPSVGVNTARVETGEHSTVLKIEMQSGDVIELTAATFQFISW